MKAHKKKKCFLRGVALSCTMVLTLTNLTGVGVVYAADSSGFDVKQEVSAAKQEVPQALDTAGVSNTPDGQTANGGVQEKPPDGGKPPDAGKPPDGTKLPDVGKTSDEANPSGMGKPAEGIKPPGTGKPTEGTKPADPPQGSKPETITGSTDGKTTSDKAATTKPTLRAAVPKTRSAVNDSAYASDPDHNVFDAQDGKIIISDAQSGYLKIAYGYSSGSSKVVNASDQITIVNTGTSPANKNITVTAVNSPVNLKISDLEITYSTSTKLPVGAIEIGNGCKVNLTLEGDNVIIAKGTVSNSSEIGAAAIHVPDRATLTIGGNGKLTAQAVRTSDGYPIGAGIGGSSRLGGVDATTNRSAYDSGTIIINSGTISAIGDGGAGIGAGTNGIAKNITINGGIVNASCGVSSAAIGGGFLNGSGLGDRSADQYITINGGHVTASSVEGGAGIGGGRNGKGGYITIAGGIVEVPEGKGINAIGAGKSDVSKPGGVDSFTTGGSGGSGTGGNAVILLKKQGEAGGEISDKTHQDQWGGVVFLQNEGKVYGTPNITESFNIPNGYTLKLDPGDQLTNRNPIKVNVGGKIYNEGKISGSTDFHLTSTGQIDNLGTLDNDGDVIIDVGGQINNGSKTEHGKGLIKNSTSASVEVNGDIYNYAYIENADITKISGNGNIFNLCSMSIEMTKNGQPIGPSNPIHYGDQLTVKITVGPGPYVNFRQWLPEQVAMQYKLWDGNTEVPLTATQTTTRGGDGTTTITQTIDIKRTDTIPWEGGKDLKVGATMENVKGLQGYMGNEASETVKYEKERIDMTGATWSSGSLVYNKNPQSVQITGLPQSVSATYIDNIKTEPGTYMAMPTLVYDTYNCMLTNVDAAVVSSLTDGYPWKIEKADVTVTSWPTASELTEGQPLSAAALTGGTASQDGNFAWKDPTQTVVWKDGQPSQDFDMVFTPKDSTHYKNESGKVSVKVNPIYYQVTFDPTGGSFTGDTTVTVQKDRKVPKPPEPAYTGAAFAGWYTDKACTKLWDFDTDKVTGNMTLYAKYTASDPLMLVAIPDKITIVNDVAAQEGKGSGSVKVQMISDPNIQYPNKTLTVMADSKIVLTREGTAGPHIDVQVYDGNDKPYNGTVPLMSFVYNGSPPAQTEQGFSLKTPIDYDKPAGTYTGYVQFQLELK